ncbi:zinc-binding dehydrogenase [Rubrobacter marinus]|uniref:Zinc-binding dehydrogenase n=1 Tax=Rubrobacter marinus TaxID=2653852 RepID=A0A6G8PYS0_9ACTN|nr:zinc-binding dehydrogenase [Rubrobacter marinus]QIN79361.1 zinc-binding dehydrogenase [Rubrobacter marinus]
MKAIRINEPGGPEVLRPEEMEAPTPGPGEVLIAVEVAGVNYADTGTRRGMAFGPHQARFPITPGFEVAGTVAALGEGVDGPSEGTRVVAVLESGGYAGYAVAPAGMVVEVPEGVDLGSAAAALLVQGITAYGVLHDAAGLQRGESVLVQAAAGGVGSLAVQLARLAGAGTIVGTAGSAEKRELVLSLGADRAVDYGRDGWADEVMEATGGRGIDVVLESVGGEAGSTAFGCLAPLGRMVMFGAASGRPMPPPDLMQMNVKGLTLTGFGGPWIRPGRAQAARNEISDHLRTGALRPVISRSFPLEEAAEAHRAIEARATTGKVLLAV